MCLPDCVNHLGTAAGSPVLGPRCQLSPGEHVNKVTSAREHAGVGAILSCSSRLFFFCLNSHMLED